MNSNKLIGDKPITKKQRLALIAKTSVFLQLVQEPLQIRTMADVEAASADFAQALRQELGHEIGVEMAIACLVGIGKGLSKNF